MRDALAQKPEAKDGQNPGATGTRMRNKRRAAVLQWGFLEVLGLNPDCAHPWPPFQFLNRVLLNHWTAQFELELWILLSQLPRMQVMGPRGAQCSL